MSSKWSGRVTIFSFFLLNAALGCALLVGVMYGYR